MNSTKTRHLIENINLSKKEILDLLKLTKMLKKSYQNGYVPKLLSGQSLAMLFQQASTRTRVSFENAMHELGGHAVFLSPDNIHFGSHEALEDTAKILSSMCAGIMFRGQEHDKMEQFAKISSVPVFNAMTYYNHPTQGLCDLFTMSEHLPSGKKLADLKIVVVGDSSDTALMAIETGQWAGALGLQLTIASPKAYSLSATQEAKLRARFDQEGGTLIVTEDVDQAVSDADFIITDVWVYYDYEDQKADRLKAFMPKYQVNRELMAKAPKHAKAMHCLPAHRDWEITSDVMDDPALSIVYQEAENRLHTQRALLAWFLYPRTKQVSAEYKKQVDQEVKDFIQKNYPKY